MTTDDRLAVYLAGPVRGPNALWRDEFELALSTAWRQHGGLNWPYPLTIRPGANIPGAPAADDRPDFYVPADLVSIGRADLVVAYLLADESGRGTGFEIGYATARGIRVLPVAGTPADRESWRFALANVAFVYPDLATAAAAVAYAAAQLAGARYDPARPG
ncbi:MAG: hypothetical protein C0498_01540 [Anaerolinea sp.]|nr:hypothetical protein [Anaerolinea sp.]